MLMGYNAAHCRPYRGEGVLYYKCDPGGVPSTHGTIDGETLEQLITALTDDNLGLVVWEIGQFKWARKWLFHYDQQTKMWVPDCPDEDYPER